MERHNIEFHVAEYNGLRSEALQSIDRMIKAVIYTLIANSAVLAFIVTNVNSNQKFGNLLIIAAWLPVLLTTLGWAHYYNNAFNIRRIGEYLVKIENQFALIDNGLGWETYLKKRRAAFLYKFRSRYLFAITFSIQFALAIYIGIRVTSSLHTP